MWCEGKRNRLRDLQLLTCALVLALLAPVVTADDDESVRTPHPVPVTRDLQALAAEARAAGLPILLVCSATLCPYCDQLDEEILEPLLLGGHDHGRVLVRKLMLDEWEHVKDFAGREVPARDFARRYRVSLTPTLLFIGPDGRELAPRMLGINTPELYGGYLEAAIDQANATLRQRRP